jgi:hypothetical protein
VHGCSILGEDQFVPSFEKSSLDANAMAVCKKHNLLPTVSSRMWPMSNLNFQQRGHCPPPY